MASRGEDVEKKKELVEQTEELIELAHQLTYHKLQQYNMMLFMLARLAYEVDQTKLRKVCKEIIITSNYNPTEKASDYFAVLAWLTECGELEMAEQLLEVIERLPETQTQRYAQLIKEQHQEAEGTKNNIRVVLIELIVKERKEWGERVEEMMMKLGIGKFTPEEMEKTAEGKMWRLCLEGKKHKE